MSLVFQLSCCVLYLLGICVNCFQIGGEYEVSDSLRRIARLREDEMEFNHQVLSKSLNNL